MEEELNYLSENIEDIESRIAELRDHNTHAVNVGEEVKCLDKELHLLNNILSYITLTEITKR